MIPFGITSHGSPGHVRRRRREVSRSGVDAAGRISGLLTEFAEIFERGAMRETRPMSSRGKQDLKVPHHGSETASTMQFIEKVNPQFAVISASTSHHLPKDTVVNRYEALNRTILRTDDHHESNVDHIICLGGGGLTLDCNYESVLSEGGIDDDD
jgi:hypothetical protein